MTDQLDPLKAKLRFWAVLLGIAQVTFGCLIGLVPPNAVEYFRGIVSAHLEFTANGVLMIVLGLLATELYLNRFALKLWFVALLLGTSTNGFSGLASAFMGATSTLTPTMNASFPPPHGVGNPIAMGLLVTCAVSILTALFLTLIGWCRKH